MSMITYIKDKANYIRYKLLFGEKAATDVQFLTDSCQDMLNQVAALNKALAHQNNVEQALRNDSVLILSAIALQNGGSLTVPKDFVDAAAQDGPGELLTFIDDETGDLQISLELSQEEEDMIDES